MALIGSGTFYYFSAFVPESKSQTLESALPSETALAFYVEDFDLIESDSLFAGIWSHAVVVGSEGMKTGLLLNLVKGTALLEQLKGTKGFMALVQTSKNSLDELWVLNQMQSQSEFESLLFGETKPVSGEPQHFSGTEYFEYGLKKGVNLYAYFNNGFTLVSYKAIVIERAIVGNGSSPMVEFVSSNLPFQRNLFLNYDLLDGGNELSPEYSSIRGQMNFKGLASFDWKWNDREISLVGNLRDKSIATEFGSPIAFQCYDEINSSIASLSLSTMEASTAFQIPENVKKLNDEMGVNITDEMSELFTNEWVSGEFNIPSIDKSASRFFMMGVSNPKRLNELLSQSRSDVDSLDSISSKNSWSALPQMLFNIESVGWGECHLSIQGQYLLAVRSQEVLNLIVSSSRENSSFLATPEFMELQETFESPSSSLSFFNLKSTELNAGLYLDLVFGSISNNTLNTASLLVRTEKGANDVFMEARLVREEKRAIANDDYEVLWISKVDSAIAWGPYEVYNHSTKRASILVCDEKAVVYQLDHNGKILWRRQLSGIPIGEPFELDVYKNNKVQYLIGSQDEVYLFDRKGRDVKHFPIKLADTATTPVVCFNRGGNKSYEVFVACANQKLYGFKGDGSPLGGWLGLTLDSTMVQPIQYFVKDKKTYFFGHTANGKVNFWTSNGKPSLAPIQLGTIASTPFTMSFASALDNCQLVTSDTAGRVVKAELSGKVEIVRLGMWSGKQYLNVLDLDGVGNRDYLFSEGNRLIGYRENETHVLKAQFESEIINPPIVLANTPLQLGIGLANGQTYLVNQSGEKMAGPNKSNGRLFMADLSGDGSLELIATKGASAVVAYKMENGRRFKE